MLDWKERRGEAVGLVYRSRPPTRIWEFRTTRDIYFCSYDFIIDIDASFYSLIFLKLVSSTDQIRDSL